MSDDTKGCGVVYVCPTRDIECGELAANWCATCPKRAALAQPAEPAAPNQVFGIIDPDYARIFTQARIVAWQYGYACVAHGSFTRDLDLLLVPWADQHVPEAGGVVNRIADVCGLDVKGPPTDKPHGRKAWSWRKCTIRVHQPRRPRREAPLSA